MSHRPSWSEGIEHQLRRFKTKKGKTHDGEGGCG